jgi:signal peptidase II
MPDSRQGAWWRWLWLSVCVFALDQATKHAIKQAFHLGDSTPVFSWFNLVLAYNTGAAFSFLADKPGWQREFFIILTLVICGALFWMLRGNHRNRVLSTALSLVIGGAIGNLYDRVSYGYVIDFIQWYIPNSSLPPWPAFNIADSAICLGAGLLIFDSFRKPPKDETTKDASREEAA